MLTQDKDSLVHNGGNGVNCTEAIQTVFLRRACSHVFPSHTLVFTALHYYLVTEMNRPWPAAITVLTKYLPAPLEEAGVQQDDRLSLLLHDFGDTGSRRLNLFCFYAVSTVMLVIVQKKKRCELLFWLLASLTCGFWFHGAVINNSVK